MPSPTAGWRQPVRALVRDPEFARGLRDMLPMLPGMAAWGMVTGVAMVKSGLGVPLALLMSLTVYAGSSQLAALPLITMGAPIWVILLTGFVVNLRFVIYSAQWRWYFGGLPRHLRVVLSYFAADANYAQFMKTWPDARPDPGQLPYFVGSVIPMWGGWQLPSIVGIVLADVIPTQWGLGFAGTLALLGLTGTLLADRATGVCAAVAALAAVAAFALPFKLHIIVAVAAAVSAGLLMEGPGRRLGRPRAAARNA